MISLEPSRFRSPLLAALPAATPGLSRRALVRRRVLVFLALVLVVLAAILVKTRWLSPRGPGYAFFWWHDKVWLPVKGVLFNWLFPASWIYLMTALCLLVLCLVSFTRKHPLTPTWQARVGRQLLGWRWSRSLMEGWDRAFKHACRWLNSWPQRVEHWPRIGPPLAARLHFPSLSGPTLLDVVVEHERRAALDRLDAQDPAATEVNSLALATDLALLSARLTTPFFVQRPRQAEISRRPDKDIFEAITRLTQVLLRIDLVLALSTTEVAELRQRLESAIADQLREFLPQWFRTPDFSLPVLAMDLALLLGLEGPPKWQDPDAELGTANGAWQHRRRVPQSIEARRQMLDKSRRRLERWSAHGHRQGRGYPSGPPVAELEVPRRRLEARLAVDIAMLAALRLAVPRNALAFLESLEGLRFAFLMAGSSGRDQGDSEMELLLTAIEQLPHAFDYRVCARLLDRKQAADPDLEEAVRRRSEVVARSDLELVRARHEELLTAAADWIHRA